MPTEIPENRSADAVLIMACAALGLLMIPAVGLFYGGMVRRKNVLSAFQQSFVLLGVVPIQWIIVGYSLSFGPDLFAGFCGGWQWVGLQGVGFEPNADLAPRVPHQLFMIFEMLAAVLPAVLISGAIAERMKFSSYVLFAILWTTFVYDPVAHWVWSPEGWIRHLGALDFGGGLVIHLTVGAGGPLLRDRAGPAEGARPRRPSPTQPHSDRVGDRLVVVRLGGTRGWAGARGQRRGGGRVCGDDPGRLRRHPRLDGS